MTSPFPSWAAEAEQAFRLTEPHVYTHEKYIQMQYSHIVAVTEGRGVPASQLLCVCVCAHGGLTLGLMGGLKAWLTSLPLFLSASPPNAVFLLGLVRTSRSVRKPSSVCMGNTDEPRRVAGKVYRDTSPLDCLDRFLISSLLSALSVRYVNFPQLHSCGRDKRHFPCGARSIVK